MTKGDVRKMKKLIGAVLVLGLLIGGAVAITNNNDVQVATDPGNGGH
jgi:hypothetical protein